MTIRLCIFVVLVITITILLPSNRAVTTYGTCLTPNHIEGTCINLIDCRFLYELVLDPELSQNDRDYLRSSQCGYRDRNVLICCPPHYLHQSATTTTRAPTMGRQPAGVLFPDSNNSSQIKSSATASNSNNNNSNLLLTFPHCGNVLSNRIYGGTETAIDEFPWTALIEYIKPTGEKGHYCGGSLVNNRYVVTAAHCVKRSEIPFGWRYTSVRLGEWDTRSNPDCSSDGCAPNHQDFGIDEAIPHPNYGTANDQHDIALLRLNKSVEFSDFIKPICIPTTTNLRSDTFVNAAMDVAGWGMTEFSQSSSIKLKATLHGKPLEECQQKYKVHYGIRIDGTQLCVGGESGVDTCRGDSGGPLMFQEDVNGKAAYYLAGVVSYGPTPCGFNGWPGVYTRVGAFTEWLAETMNA